jgi:very-short-patch-repair endonuclease/predicted transcriptional regulator of viral defense system
MIGRMTRDFHIDRAIRGERESRGVDAVIAALATRQHGVVSREQLRRIGLSEDEIDRRIRAGRLHPIHRGVYAVGHRRLSREGRYLAAVLASGEGAVLSHRSAADLWELRASTEDRIEVTVPAHRRGDSRIRIRQWGLDPRETMTRHGIRVTKPLRTLLDLAACVPQTELERAIRQAVYQRLTTTALLADAVYARAGHRGMKQMRRTLIHLGEAPGLIRSKLEQEFLAFLRRHRLPFPELNVELRIGNRKIEADCVWRQQRVIVELDGRDAHDSAPAFESDRARDSALTAALWRVVRVTSARMRTDGPRLAKELRALLA